MTKNINLGKYQKILFFVVFSSIFFVLFMMSVSAQQPNLTVTKTASAAFVLNGSNFTYTITITNTGDANATNITIFETFSGYTVVLSSQPAFQTPSLNNTIVIPGNLTAGTSTIVNITVLVNASIANGTILNNTVAVHYNSSNETGDPFAFIANASVTNTVVAPPALTVTKTDSSDPVANNSNILYIITLNNTGGVTARNVTIFETFDGYTTFVSASPAANLSATNNTWFLDNLAPGITTTVNITVLVNGSTPDGTVVNNSVSVHYNMSETSTTFISNATANTTVIAEPNITVTKIDSPDPVANGSNIVYTITLNNTGGVTARNVTIFETFDGYTTFVSASPAANLSATNNTWFLDNLAPGITTTVNITVLANGSTPNGTVVNNSVAVHYNTTGGNSTSFISNASANTTVIVQPAITVTKTDSPDPVGNASNIVYTLSLINTGGITARNVTIFETFDGYTTFVSASPAANLSATNNTWFLDNLAPGITITVNITVLVNGSIPNGTIVNNSVSVHYNMSETSTTFISNATANTTVIAEPAVLSVTKTDSPEPSTGAVRYTITVVNRGGVVNNIVINDNLSRFMFFSIDSVESLQPFNYTDHTIIWHINLSFYDRFQVNYSANAERSGTFTNNVSVIYDNSTSYITTTANTSNEVNIDPGAGGGSGSGSSGSSGGSSGGSAGGSSSSSSTTSSSTGDSAAQSQGITGLGSTTPSTSSSKQTSSPKQQKESSSTQEITTKPTEQSEETSEETQEESTKESEKTKSKFSLSFTTFLILLLIVLIIAYIAYRNYPKTKEESIKWDTKKKK